MQKIMSKLLIYMYAFGKNLIATFHSEVKLVSIFSRTLSLSKENKEII